MNTKILCIESSTEVCSVCLAINGQSEVVKELEDFKHSSYLLPLIIETIEEAKISKKELNAVAFSKGPGSYTGLRVGASTAKGLAFGLDLPLITIDTLQALASGVKKESSPETVIVPMIDARRNEVYTAMFDAELNFILPTRSLIIDTHLEEFIEGKSHIIFCGNGAHKVKTNVMGKMETVETKCTASNLAALSFDLYQNEIFEELDHFEPNYLKPPNITKPKALIG